MYRRICTKTSPVCRHQPITQGFEQFVFVGRKVFCYFEITRSPTKPNCSNPEDVVCYCNRTIIQNIMTDKKEQVIANIRSKKWWILNRQERFEYNGTIVEDGQNPNEIVFLSLSSKKEIDNNWLEQIGQITSLESLHIDLTSVTDNGIFHLSRLENLKSLNLRGTRITDNSITTISSLKNIDYLWLNDTLIKGETLYYLKNLKRLTNLFLGGTEINDETLVNINELKNLEYLQLFGTSVTEKSLELFKSLPNLKSLDITRTMISEKSVENLKIHLPNLSIHIEDW